MIPNQIFYSSKNSNDQKTEIKDPVCGMTVDPQTSSNSYTYKEQIYFFCCDHCFSKFQTDPEQYLNKPPITPTVEEQPSDQEAEYICPMHLDIRRNRFGYCPICGMDLEPQLAASIENNDPENLDMKKRFWLSLVLTIPVFLAGMSEMILGKTFVGSWFFQISNWIQLFFSTLVVFWGGWPFFQRGWTSLINRTPNMFTLIVMGIAASYFYSFFVVVFSEIINHSGRTVVLYFETAAVITTIVLLGQVLELRARNQTSNAIQSLLNLSPKTARLVREDGSEEDIPVADLRSGQLLLIRPGEQIPVDGVVLNGCSSVDESMVTGESIPIEKISQSHVTGGTINQMGSFVMRAEKVGQKTLLAQIISMVSQAQRTQVPIQRMVDVVSSYFVPTIIATSILTFILWSLFGPKPSLAFALVNSVSVLIIACPCALGLATPMSVMVSTGRGARGGILIKKADVLQSLEKIDTLVIDKTGTLTEGRPSVSSVITSANWNQSNLLAAAASLEQNSEHPLAAAIVSEANRRKLPLAKADKFKAFAGQGVTGQVSGNTFVLGNEKFLNELKILTKPLSQEADTLRKTGHIVVFAASNSQLVGLLAVKDPIKPTTHDAIAKLHKEGLRIIMLTGDNEKTASKIAEDLKIYEVKAEVTPQQKVEVIKQLQASGCRVAMAGDGINDAPALAQAQVGIAMGTGTDVALYSAGITLVKGDLNGIVRARRLSRITMRNIRQNLFFSFFYNTLGIPLAAGVLYPVLGILLNPMIAAVAMICSSISVIANALRLRNISL